jgi:hypothetical protein
MGCVLGFQGDHLDTLALQDLENNLPPRNAQMIREKTTITNN